MVIVYKLHLECGKLINLYDWLQAFVAVVCPDADDTGTGASASKDKGKGKGNGKGAHGGGSAAPSAELQARFIRAVTELQFAGFVKPSSRKTDHVTRLTWGL